MKEIKERKRYLKSGDLILSKNDKMYTVAWSNMPRCKSIIVHHKSQFSNLLEIPFTEIFGAMKK